MDALSYFALAILIFVVLTLAYGMIAIHDIPYHMAVSRIAQGQLQPTGNLVDPGSIRGEGRILVGIEPEEDLAKYLIVPGSTAQVAIYTEHMHNLSVMRKVLLRMKSWTNFIFGDGH